MPLFPAVKLMDSVIGVDMHALAPIPGIPLHAYVGPVYLWHTPVFPSANVFINGMPACTVGSMGYFLHVPQGVPLPPTPTNTPYWKRYVTNIPMVLTLTGLTILANLAIAGIASLIPKPKSVEDYIKDVTGIDTSSRAATWESIKGTFSAYTKWQTWAKLLMPPVPYPGAQGSSAVGSPNVTVNGGPLGFVAPLVGTSCSDISFVPNGVTLGFTNVLVGVSFADIARGLAVNAGQAAVQHGVSKGVDAAKKKLEERKQQQEGQNNKCTRPGEPIDPVTGASENEFLDYQEPHPGGFRFQRIYKSRWHEDDGPLGWGFRHSYQHELRLGADDAIYLDPEGRSRIFPRNDQGRYAGAFAGFTMEDQGNGRIVLRHGGEGTMGFERDPTDASVARLVGRVRPEGVREVIAYGPGGTLDAVRQSWIEEDGSKQTLEFRFRHDAQARLVAILRGVPGGSAHAIVAYNYDSAGCLTAIRDALGAEAGHGYDEYRRMTRVTDCNGYSFNYTYDKQGRCVHSEGDDGLWRVSLRYAPGQTLVTEADNALWVFSYDEAGTVTEIRDPYGGVTQRVTGPDGRVLWEIDSGGQSIQLLYDDVGWHTGRLDPWGNLWPPKDEAPNLPNPLAPQMPATQLEREWGEPAPNDGPSLTLPSGIAAWAAQHRGGTGPAVERRDALGRVIERTDPNGRSETFAYDPAGNVTVHRDKDGQERRTRYASWNLPVAEEDSLGNVVRYRYTRREKIAAIIDANGNESKYVYDCKDRLTRVTRHDVVHEMYRYDVGDRLIEKTDGEGRPLLSFEIGPNGLPSKRILASGDVHSFAYDGRANVTEASTSKAKVLIGHEAGLRVSDTRDGRGVQHRYDGTRLAGTSWFDRFVAGYDTMASGDMLIRTPVGRPIRIQRAADGSVLKTLGNGTRELSLYDGDGRCTARAVWREGDDELAWWTRYQYSGAGELRVAEHSQRGETHHEYDSAHRLLVQRHGNHERRYVYDKAGNLLSMPARGELRYTHGNRLAASGSETFVFNERNHLAEVAPVDGRHAIYEYDSADMLVRITGGATFGEWTAEYDGLRRRIAKEIDSARTEFFWDGERIVAEAVAAGPLRIYIYPDAAALVPLCFIDYPRISVDPSEGRIYYVLHDQVGLPTLIEDGAGREVWRARSVDPYGAVDVAPGNSVTYALRFPGHYLDAETGLHYNRYRYYNPSLGRYIQSDPIGQSGGINLYAYAANPLVEVDVLGLAHKKAGPKKPVDTEDPDSSSKGGKSTGSKKQGDHAFAKGMQKVGDEMEGAAQRSDMSDGAKARVGHAAAEIDNAVSDPAFSRTVDKGPTPEGGDQQSRDFGTAVKDFRTDQDNFFNSVADAESAPPSQRDAANAGMQQAADRMNDSFGRVTGNAEDTQATTQMNDPKATQAGRDGLQTSKDSMKSMTDDIVKSTTESNAPPPTPPPDTPPPSSGS